MPLPVARNSTLKSPAPAASAGEPGLTSRSKTGQKHTRYNPVWRPGRGQEVLLRVPLWVPALILTVSPTPTGSLLPSCLISKQHVEPPSPFCPRSQQQAPQRGPGSGALEPIGWPYNLRPNDSHDVATGVLFHPLCLEATRLAAMTVIEKVEGMLFLRPRPAPPPREKGVLQDGWRQR